MEQPTPETLTEPIPETPEAGGEPTPPEMSAEEAAALAGKTDPGEWL